MVNLRSTCLIDGCDEAPKYFMRIPLKTYPGFRVGLVCSRHEVIYGNDNLEMLGVLPCVKEEV